MKFILKILIFIGFEPLLAKILTEIETLKIVGKKRFFFIFHANVYDVVGVLVARTDRF